MHSEQDATWKRRRLLQALAGGFGGINLFTVTDIAGAEMQEEDPSVVFENQESDGESVIVARVVTDSTVQLIIRDSETVYGRKRLNAGRHEDITVHLENPITESKTVSARLYPGSGGSRLAIDQAVINVGDTAGRMIDGMEPTLVEADPASGFNYPYFLYVPNGITEYEQLPVLVEPTNTGTSTDDFSKHKAAGEDTIGHGPGRTIADELVIPFLVPVIPRPTEEPVDWRHYTHALDAETLEIDSGPLERVDLQLLNMVDHARKQLAADGYSLADEGILLNGFSASGNFVDRFTVLHPDQVLSVTAGGLNGMALLPAEEYDGRTLPFHVGIANAEDLIGEQPDLDALDETNQFLYMGEDDENDTIPYDDAWTDDDLRQLALEVYGEDMITDRWQTCQAVYEDAGIGAEFRLYEDTGHTPRPAIGDMIEFHRDSLDAANLRTSTTETDEEPPETGQGTEETPPATATTTATSTPTTQSAEVSETGTTTSANGPGVGIGGTVASVLGLGYLLQRRTDDE